MKRLFYFCLVTTLLFAGSCTEKFDDSLLTGRVDDLEERVTKLEEMCHNMNTNITSLQTIVGAMQQGDYITKITPITEDGKTIGYNIEFVSETAYKDSNDKGTACKTQFYRLRHTREHERN